MMSAGTHAGAVAAGHELTGQTAVEVLKSGGNAFDAAIAAAWMACVCEPVLASPGGGGFAMTHQADGSTRLYDFFAQTPRTKRADAADFRQVFADFGTAVQGFHIGQGATATPGMVPGLFRLNTELGSWSMQDLVHPAVLAGRTGVRMTRFQRFLNTVIEPILIASHQAAALFVPDGRHPAVGEMVTNPGLSAFLELLGQNGLPGYQGGKVLECMLERQLVRGHLGEPDFSGYQVERRQPLVASICDATVYMNPLPSAGGTLIGHTLAHISGTDGPSIAGALDATDKARRDTGGNLKALARQDNPPSYRGTTHISVIDRAGNACAMTLSNGEGNGELVGPFGFMLNNMLGEEDVNPFGALGWKEDIRMSSMMCPCVALGQDGSVVALGSGGSNRIRSAILQVLLRLLADGLPVEQSIAAPRLHVESGHLDFEDLPGLSGRTELTTSFPDHLAWPEPNLFFGGCHMVRRTVDGRFEGAGDPRRGGVFLHA